MKCKIFAKCCRRFCVQVKISPWDSFSKDGTMTSFDTYTNDRHLRYRFCHLYNLLIYRQLGKLRHRP